MSEKKVELTNGAWATFKDPKALRVRDRKNVLRNASNEEGLMQGVSIIDGLIAILVKEWSFEMPIPSIRIAVLEDLEIPDYDILATEAGKAQEVLFPQLGETDASKANPDSPFGKSSDQDTYYRVKVGMKPTIILMSSIGISQPLKSLAGHPTNMTSNLLGQWIGFSLSRQKQKRQERNHMINSNLRLVRKAVGKQVKSIDVATRMARDEMMMALIQLSKEKIEGARPYTVGPRGGRTYQKATPGQPPMNRTGNLRRSIRGEKFNTGFANYSAIVGPTIEYGRRVELGGGNWPAGVRFPYMEPAYAQFRTQIVPQVTAKYFRRFR